MWSQCGHSSRCCAWWQPMPRVTESVHVGGQAVNGGLVGSKQIAVAQRKHGAAAAGRRGQAVQLARAALSKEQQAVAKEVQRCRAPCSRARPSCRHLSIVCRTRRRNGIGTFRLRAPCSTASLLRSRCSCICRGCRGNASACVWRSGASVAWETLSVRMKPCP